MFRDDTNNSSIHFAEANETNAGGAFDIFTTLSPGIVYQLKVRTHLSGESNAAGIYQADSSFLFHLYPVVPEPATVSLAVMGLLALIGLTRRR